MATLSSLSDQRFSRASLYTSLDSYDDKEDSESTKKHKAPSLAKASNQLCQFYEIVSQDYHRNCSSSEARNTASRPLAASELSDRVLTKSLTLIGGGYNKGLQSSGRRRKTNAKKKRRRRKATKWTDLSSTQLGFVQKLNICWNDYVWKILKCTRGINIPVASLNALKQARLEWMGARVRVESCMSNPSWCKRRGIVVQITKETWVVALDQSLPSSEGVSTKVNETSIRGAQTIILPKRGTALVALLPLPIEENNPQEGERNLCLVLRESL
jgi:hypothetical protein